VSAYSAYPVVLYCVVFIVGEICIAHCVFYDLFIFSMK
jgi:hypothetical protein